MEWAIVSLVQQEVCVSSLNRLVKKCWRIRLTEFLMKLLESVKILRRATKDLMSNRAIRI